MVIWWWWWCDCCEEIWWERWEEKEGRTLYFLLLGLPSLVGDRRTALPSSSENFLEMSSFTTLSSTLRNFNVEDAVQDFLSLECHTLRSAYNAAVVSGVLAISTHLVVSQLCKLLGNKLVAKDGGFATHQFVAMYNMLLLFFVGGLEWTHASMPPTASDRLFGWIKKPVVGIDNLVNFCVGIFLVVSGLWNQWGTWSCWRTM